MLWCHKVTASR